MGELPASPLNEVMNFLNAEDIVVLFGANKHLNKTIKSNPFAQKRITDAKPIIKKIYDIVHKIALSEYGKSFYGRYGVPDGIWSSSLGRCLKKFVHKNNKI